MPRPVRAQAGAGAFLRQEPDARSAALAGATGAAAADSAAVLVNPAALARLGKPEVGATRVVLFEDTSFDVLSGAIPTRAWGTFGGAYVRQASGGFQGRSGPNDAPSPFTVEQSALLAGWGYSPRLPWDQAGEGAPRRLAVGAAFKSVREKIGSSAGSGGGLDLGFLLRARPDLSVGLTFGNLIAPKPAFVGSGVPYDRVTELSGAWDRRLGADWDLGVLARLRRVETEGTQPAGGVELRYARLASLRLGVQERGLSTGFGVSYGNTRLDYAALLHDLGVSHSFTLVQRFGQTREELEETIRRGISRLSRSDGARLAKAYLAKAEQEMRDGRTAEARRDVEAASLLDPENADIAERLKKVDAQWEEGLRRQTVERLAALARRQEDQGNLLAARQYWSAVLDLDAADTDAASALGRIDGALSSAERARAESLRQAEAANEIALGLAGAATYLARGALRQARLEAEKVGRRHPDNPQVRDFLKQTDKQISEFVAARKSEAAAAAAAGDDARAAAALQAARREAPDDAELAKLESAARSRVRGSLSEDARKQAEQLYYRAVDQYLKGRYDAAGALADEVLKLDPSSESARTLKEKVDAARRYAR